MIKKGFRCPQGPKEFASFGLRNVVLLIPLNYFITYELYSVI